MWNLVGFQTRLRIPEQRRVFGMIPGLGAMRELKEARSQLDDRQVDHVEAIINSMTPAERRNHTIINGSRRKRIAKGSGTNVEDVNRLLRQFAEMRKMLKAMGGMTANRKGRKRLMQMMKGRR